MSRQVDETLDVLGLVRDRYLRDPSPGVRRHRIEATRDVANSMGGIDYRTVLDKYRRKMGLQAVVELDNMILAYLTDPLNTQLERALQTLAVDDNDLLRIDQFFAHDEEAALIDIGLGGVFGTDLVQRRHRSVSAEELASRRRNAADIGRRAEALLDRMLNDAVKSDEIQGYDWMSKDDVTQPCDFSFIEWSGNERYLEVKGTKLAFSRPFHVAWNELVFGSEKGAAWLLCRCPS